MFPTNSNTRVASRMVVAGMTCGFISVFLHHLGDPTGLFVLFFLVAAFSLMAVPLVLLLGMPPRSGRGRSMAPMMAEPPVSPVVGRA